MGEERGEAYQRANAGGECCQVGSGVGVGGEMGEESYTVLLSCTCILHF